MSVDTRSTWQKGSKGKMAKIVRSEFMGSSLGFWLLCVTIIGIPLAILYLVNGTIRVEEDINDPERFLQGFREGRRAW